MGSWVQCGCEGEGDHARDGAEDRKVAPGKPVMMRMPHSMCAVWQFCRIRLQKTPIRASIVRRRWVADLRLFRMSPRRQQRLADRKSARRVRFTEYISHSSPAETDSQAGSVSEATLQPLLTDDDDEMDVTHPEAVPVVARKGITLRGIKHLQSILKDLLASEDSPFRHSTNLGGRECPGAESLESLTTTQLVYLWIKRPEVTGTSRLADVPHLIDPADIRQPTYFISHAWQSTVAKLFKTIESFLIDASDETAVWLDFVAINQHDGAENREDVRAFVQVIKQCKDGTLVVVDQQRCNPATRGWCLYEW